MTLALVSNREGGNVITSEWRRVLVALLSVLGLTVGLLSVSAGPAAAADPDYHDCQVIGTSGGYQGVHCVDQYWGDGQFQVANVVLCQTTGGTLVECAGIHEQPGTCANYLADCVYAPQGICGVRFGHSACDVRRVVNWAPAIDTRCGYRHWGNTLDSVVLPNGVTVSANYGGRKILLDCS